MPRLFSAHSALSSRLLAPVSGVALVLISGGAVRLDAQTVSTPTTTAQNVADGGTLTVTATGAITVSGSTTAVALPSTATSSGSLTSLMNSGAISQTGTGRAIRSISTNANLSIQNFSAATISSIGNDTIAVGSGTVGAISVALTNAGTITSGNVSTTAGNQTINFGNLTSGSNSVTNSGTITAYVADAVRPGVNGTVVNTGTITSTQNAATGSGSDGIDAQTNTGVHITNSSSTATGASPISSIEGGRHGITGGNTAGTAFVMSITNYARGVIQGDNGSGINIDGINANEVVTVINNGTITGNGSQLTTTAGVVATSQDGDGVDVDGVVNITNTGTIRSINAIGDTSEGVTVGGGTIINSGTIQGSIASGNTSVAVGRGITIAGVDKDATGNPIPVQAPYAATTITNSGLIKGDSDSGIAYTSALTSGFTHTIMNLAGGTIEGGGAVAAVVLGPDNDVVNNSGVIRADTSNLALDMGAGTNTLNITGGSASIVGNVSGGAGGANTLTITPGAGNSFSYGGVFSNFNTVQIGASQTAADGVTNVSGGKVTLSGNSIYAGTTTIASGSTLIAANVAASGGSATGTGGVTVQGGGVLAGAGRVGGAVTLAKNGRLSPSNSNSLPPGMLTLGNDLNTMDGSIFTFALGSGVANSDRVLVGGALNFTGPGQLVFDILDNGLALNTRYDLVDFTSAPGLTLSNLSFGNVPAGFMGSFDLSGGSIGLTVTAVPEPAVAQALLVGGLALGGVLLRRKRS